MEHHNSIRLRATAMVEILLILLSSVTSQEIGVIIDCPTVIQLLNTCSAFITYSSPDPIPGTPCCDAIVGLGTLGDSTENKQTICRCIMGLIAAYDPSATAIATLPGFCGVSLGFTIEPNIDCTTIL